MSSKLSYNKKKLTSTALISLVLVSLMSLVQLYEKNQRYQIPKIEASLEDLEEIEAEGGFRKDLQFFYEEGGEANKRGESKETVTSLEGAEIIVHIAGAVQNPSIISIREGARLYEAVNQAGGLTEEADQSLVNLAQELVDGSQYIIPAQGDQPLSAEIANPAGQTVNKGTAGEGDKVNINTATAKELESLDGIGPVLAERIIEHRDSVGSFRDINGLLDVKGIGTGKFEGIRDKITC